MLKTAVRLLFVAMFLLTLTAVSCRAESEVVEKNGRKIFVDRRMYE